MFILFFSFCMCNFFLEIENTEKCPMYLKSNAYGDEEFFFICFVIMKTKIVFALYNVQSLDVFNFIFRKVGPLWVGKLEK